MFILKNKSATPVNIPKYNITLQPDENRQINLDYNEVDSETKQYINTHISNNILEILSINNAVLESNLTERDTFFYLEGSKTIAKNQLYSYQFIGKLNQLRIKNTNKNIVFRIVNLGINYPWVSVKAFSELMFDFDYKLVNPKLEFKSDNGVSSIDIYVDGTYELSLGLSSLQLEVNKFLTYFNENTDN